MPAANLTFGWTSLQLSKQEQDFLVKTAFTQPGEAQGEKHPLQRVGV